MKAVNWIGTSLDEVRSFPEDVRQEVGYTLYLAQLGDKGVNAVPMVGFGSAKVLEVVINDSGDTYRAVYTVKFRHAIYVLHAFQKKSKRGNETPRPDLMLIRKRLRLAEGHHRERYEKVTRKDVRNDNRA